jgi:hypothetical protein
MMMLDVETEVTSAANSAATDADCVVSPSAHIAMHATSDDPWTRTLAALSMFSHPPRDMPREISFADFLAPRARVRTGSAHRQPPTFTLTVLEHLANSLVVIAWHDPTLCNYEEQVWSPALARYSGRCALSGQRIVRGDIVYKPRTRGRVTPLNGDAMILGTELQKARETPP